MKISQLIEELKSIQNDIGDVNCYVYARDEYYSAGTSIETVDKYTDFTDSDHPQIGEKFVSI